jgi:hypothetical protein
MLGKKSRKKKMANAKKQQVLPELVFTLDFSPPGFG